MKTICSLKENYFLWRASTFWPTLHYHHCGQIWEVFRFILPVRYRCRGSECRYSEVIMVYGDIRVLSWFGTGTFKVCGRTGESWLVFLVEASFWIDKQLWSLPYSKNFPIFHLVFHLYQKDNRCSDIRVSWFRCGDTRVSWFGCSGTQVSRFGCGNTRVPWFECTKLFIEYQCTFFNQNYINQTCVLRFLRY